MNARYWLRLLAVGALWVPFAVAVHAPWYCGMAAGFLAGQWAGRADGAR